MSAIPPTDITDHEAAGDGAERSVQEARQGANVKNMLSVLRVSTVLGVLALVAAFVGVSLSKHQPAAQHSSPPAAVASTARDGGAS